MKFRQLLTSAFALSAFAVFTTVAAAQQSAQQPQQGQGQGQQGERQRSGDETVTGCLAKGDTDGQFVLTDKSGTKTNVTAGSGVELEKHAANHTVRLTGSKSAAGAFTASKVEHISATCDTAK